MPQSDSPAESVENPVFADARGKLTFAELGGGLPFAPARYFLVYDVPAGETRGGHAHRCCEQYLIAVSGAVAATIDDGHSRTEHVLDHPDLGLHVLASEPYDPADYIDDYQEFLALKSTR